MADLQGKIKAIRARHLEDVKAFLTALPEAEGPFLEGVICGAYWAGYLRALSASARLVPDQPR